MKEQKLTISLNGRNFDFDLCHRTLDIAEPGLPPVEHYWMPVGPIHAGGGLNVKSCIDLWWTSMAAEGLTTYRFGMGIATLQQVYANHINYALARLYERVAKSKNRQEILVDAYARGASHPTELRVRNDLDEETGRQLRNLATSRDMNDIAREIEKALGGQFPTSIEQPDYDAAFDYWMAGAVEALRLGGTWGLKRFLDEVLVPQFEKVIRRGPKKAGTRHLRRFVNMVTYEAKVAFMTCYANAWVHLLPRLRQHHALNVPSAHLLRLWHHQTLTADGRRPAFFGHVLALHPISILLLNQPDYLTVLGRYLKSTLHLRSDANIDNSQNDAYWNLVGATLTAMHEYTQQRERDRSRHSTFAIQPVAEQAARNDTVSSEAELLANLAVSQGWSCTCARSSLIGTGYEVLSQTDQTARVHYRCRNCGQRCNFSVSADDFTSSAA